MHSIPQRMGSISRRMGANLPHWRQECATYAVTFRQADSLPATVLNRWRRERESHIQRAIDNNMPLGTDQLKRLARCWRYAPVGEQLGVHHDCGSLSLQAQRPGSS